MLVSYICTYIYTYIYHLPLFQVLIHYITKSNIFVACQRLCCLANPFNLHTKPIR